MVNDALLNITEDSSEQYVDADLTEYSSSQPVVPEQNSSLGEQQLLQNPAELQPQNVFIGHSLGSTEKVDLPEGLCSQLHVYSEFSWLVIE